MLMGNTMHFHNPDLIEHIFDLKGSLVNREVKGEVKNTSTLKDINLLHIMRRRDLLRFPKADRDRIVNAL